MYYKFILLLATLLHISGISAQETTIEWRQISQDKFSLNTRKILNNPREKQEIKLPNLDGQQDVFIIKPVHFIAPKVAHQYTIQTFQGYKKNDPTTLIAFNLAPNSISAEILDKKKGYSIESIHSPSAKQSIEVLLTPHKYNRSKKLCTVTDKITQIEQITKRSKQLQNLELGGKRTLRLVMSASKEYSEQFGGSPYSTTNVLNAIAAGINSINIVFKRDLGIEFQLVSGENTIIPPTAEDNPFNGSASDRLNQNQTFIKDKGYGIWSYDLGHHVTWGETGGSATPGVLCYPGYQSKGASGTTRGTTVLWLDYVVHEIGHQMGAEHNFSSQECGASWNNYRFEPGQGSSIMSYAALCGYGYTNETNPFFHAGSLQKIVATLNDRLRYTCQNANRIVVGNNQNSPVVNAKENITIPKETPFVLVGNITDADGDTISYQWEQFDGNGSPMPGYPDCTKTNNALFRFREPIHENYRFFPQHSNVTAGNNANVTWEKLPCTARTMNFSLLGRDNNTEYGRIGLDQMTVTVANTGPFAITSFNNGETLSGDSFQTITWSVNGTNTHCPNVDVLISTDGGNSYTELANNVSNNGNHQIQLPNVNSNNAVLAVRCHVNTPAGTRLMTRDLTMASTFYDTTNTPLTIRKIVSAVPIKIGDVTGQVYQNNQIQLKWFTITEENNAGFEIQRKIDQIWKKIGFVAGNGNRKTRTNYTFIDSAPLQGRNLYRLKQLDYDHSFQYSKLVEIIQLNKIKTAYYNTTKQTIEWNTDCQEGLISIYTSTGQMVEQKNTTTETPFRLSHLPNGFYIGSFQCKQKTFTFKIVK